MPIIGSSQICYKLWIIGCSYHHALLILISVGEISIQEYPCCGMLQHLFQVSIISYRTFFSPLFVHFQAEVGRGAGMASLVEWGRRHLLNWILTSHWVNNMPAILNCLWDLFDAFLQFFYINKTKTTLNYICKSTRSIRKTIQSVQLQISIHFNIFLQHPIIVVQCSWWNLILYHAGSVRLRLIEFWWAVGSMTSEKQGNRQKEFKKKACDMWYVTLDISHMFISSGWCIIDIPNWFLTSLWVNTVQTIRIEHDNNHQVCMSL